MEDHRDQNMISLVSVHKQPLGGIESELAEDVKCRNS